MVTRRRVRSINVRCCGQEAASTLSDVLFLAISPKGLLSWVYADVFRGTLARSLFRGRYNYSCRSAFCTAIDRVIPDVSCII